MKKIMFFIESLAAGGAEKALVNLIKCLHDRYDIYVYTVTDEDIYQKEIAGLCHYHSFLCKRMYREGGLAKFFFWIGIRFIYHAPSSLVYQVFIKEKYDIEVAFVEGFATKLISSSTNLDSKKYAWVHIDTLKNEYADNFFFNTEEQIDAYRKYDKIVAVSDTVKESFIKKYNINENIEIIHNIINTDEITIKSAESIDCVPDTYLQMIAIGRLEQQKGFIRLVEALNHIDRRNYSLWIIGEGSQRKELENRIKEYRMNNNVKLLGFQKNPYKFISKADVFVCSSYAEGYSTAISESLLLGVPVFSVECSGVVEQLKQGKLGRIVPNTDEDLIEMLIELISDPAIIDRYRNNIAGMVTEQQEDNIDKVERLFNEQSDSIYTNI